MEKLIKELGLDLTDEAISKLSGAFTKHVGDQYVKKELYTEKTDEIKRINETITTLKEQLVSVEGNSETVKKLKEEHEKAVKELEDYRKTVQTEKDNAVKLDTLKTQLKAKGANPTVIDLLTKEFDVTKLEVENGTLKDFENLVKPVQEKYKDLFGEVKPAGTDPAVPPAGGSVAEPKTLAEALKFEFERGGQ